jgi:hypothetical protein
MRNSEEKHRLLAVSIGRPRDASMLSTNNEPLLNYRLCGYFPSVYDYNPTSGLVAEIAPSPSLTF